MIKQKSPDCCQLPGINGIIASPIAVYCEIVTGYSDLANKNRLGNFTRAILNVSCALKRVLFSLLPQKY